MAKIKILIVDDERPTREVMARMLAARYECLTAADASEALAVIERNPDLALMVSDVRMPGEDGVSLVKRAKALRPALACILLTAYGTVELAVKAMQEGADDFLTKPVTDIEQLEARVAKAIRTSELAREVVDLRNQLAGRDSLESFTGSSEPMQRVYHLIRQAAPSQANVLISGPSGTGKELVAHALHRLSSRATGPFVAVECAALSSSLLESELFGHEKGAFTDAIRQKIGRFEAANGGTLFLDEISEIDAPTQVKLLRVLETRSFQRVGGTEEIKTDIRIVAATNRNLAEFVAEGRFREDLYYRLNVIEIKLPALRDRPGDIALLASRFLRESSAANGSRVKRFAPEALRLLEAYAWPGNVRQLRNIVERMVVLAAGETLTASDVPAELVAPVASVEREQGEVLAVAKPSALPVSVEAVSREVGSLAELEKERILAALAASGGNKTSAAESLGISRRTLHRKLKAWGVSH